MAKQILMVGKISRESATITTSNDLWLEAAISLMDQGFTKISVKSGEKKTEVEGNRN